MNARVTIFTVVVVITCIAIEMGEQGPSQYPGIIVTQINVGLILLFR